LSQITQYAGVLAKIGAEKSKLLSETKLKTLTETKNLTEFTAQLRETSYQTQIAKVPLPLTSRKLERAFNENLIETYAKIIKNSPKSVANYLCLYLLKFEIENIKALIKATANANLSSEQKLARIYLSTEEYLKKLAVIEEAAKASTMKQMVSNLKGTEYSAALGKGLQSFEEKASTAGFDVLLDKVFYEKLCDSYDSLPKKEKTHAYFYASVENDSFTLLTLLRGKALNYEANWLRTIIPHKNFNLSSDTVEALVMAPDFESAFKIGFESYYGKFFTKVQIPEEAIANAERVFRRAMFQHAKVSTIPEIFNIGAPLAFMILKEAEVHNLIASSSGVEAGVNPEGILNQMSF
jgi:vacuolar-type H+-ATPase subunit C/Vma6